MSLDEALPCTVLVCGVTIALLLFLLHLLTRRTNPHTIESRTRSRSSSHCDLISTSGIPWPSSQPRTEQCFTPPQPSSHPAPDNFPSPPSSDLPSSDSSIVRERKLLQSLCREACSKAKDAGRHPSYVPLCLTLVHHYTLDINSPVLSNGMSIFLCSCLSGSQELVSSLLPLADLAQTTHHGETALYLAVYAAAHRSLTEQAGGEVPVIRLLLEAGVGVDLPNQDGVTALQVASRKGCLALARLLLDWGASPQGVSLNNSLHPTSGHVERFNCSMASNYRDTSMVTRARARGSALNLTMCATGSDLNSTLNTANRALNSTMDSQIRGCTTGKERGMVMKQGAARLKSAVRKQRGY